MPKNSKRYRVVGGQPVLDTPPGGTFEAALDKTHEQFLIGIGAIEVAKDSDKKD